MKILTTLIAILIVAVGLSQDCDSILRENKDKFTDNVSYETGVIIMEVDGKRLVWSAKLNYGKAYYDNILSVSFILPEGCIDKNPELTFLFADNSKKVITGGNSFNCDGVAAMYFFHKGMGTKQFVKNIKELSEKVISSIRVDTYRGNFDFDMTESQASEFQQAMSCAYNRINGGKD